MSQNIEFDEIDPVVGRMLELLRATPERDVHAVRAGKSRFVSELNSIFPSTYSSSAGSWPQSSAAQEPARPLRANYARGSRRPAYVYAIITIVAFILLLSTGMVTAHAAEDTLPGDALYSLKTGLEHVRLSVTIDPDEKMDLYLEYADRRLKEASQLIRIGRYTEAETVVVELEQKVKSARVALTELEQNDPDQADRMKTEMVKRLAGFSLVVTTMTNAAPETLQPALNSALTSVDTIIFEETGTANGNLPAGTPPPDDAAGPPSETEEPVVDDSTTPEGGDDQANSNDAADPNANATGTAEENNNGEDANANTNSNDNVNGDSNTDSNSNDGSTCVDNDNDGFCDDLSNTNTNTNANANANNNGASNANNNGNNSDNKDKDKGEDEDEDYIKNNNGNGNGWGKGGKPK